MIKFLISTIVTALLAFACGLYLPWWSVAIATFVVAYFIYQSPLKSFATGFFAVLVLWLILILLINSANENILVARISLVMGFSETLLIVLSSFIGGLVGGLGALTGALLRKATN
jgi:hypothetical protein